MKNIIQEPYEFGIYREPNIYFYHTISHSYIRPELEINKRRNIKMSSFENKLYEDTQSEIARLEEELNFLRQFLELIGSNFAESKKPIPKPVKKSLAVKSAQKKTKAKRTNYGKKIGRPTNAEKVNKEIENALQKEFPKIKKELS